MNKHLCDQRVLVTGGRGFVGSHLVSALVDAGATVVVPYLTENPLSYFSSNLLERKVISVPMDINDFQSVLDLITKYEFNFIFHLAAQPIVETAYLNPLRTLTTNIIGTVNLLESVRLYRKVTGMIVASSDKAYGKHGEKKYVEGDSLRGDHPYEVSKSAADLITYSYFKTYNVPVVITRFGNIYGEGDLNISRLIPAAMLSLLNHKPLELRSDGSYVRDYLYVKDVVRGYMLLMEKLPKIAGEAFNFGSHDTFNVKDAIQQLETALQQTIPYVILNQSKNEIPHQSLDFTKIKALGWEPHDNFQSTGMRIYEWYKNQFS